MTQIDTTSGGPPKAVLKSPEKLRAWVIYQLSCKGQSLASVAREADVDRRTLYHVFNRPYPRMELFVATAVGMKPQALFPARYDAHGLPKRNRTGQQARRHGGKPSTRKSAGNLQTAGMA